MVDTGAVVVLTCHLIFQSYYHQQLYKAIAMEAKNSTTSETYKNYTYLDIYKGWQLFKTSCILEFLWIILSMSAYGISFGAASLGFSVYLNIFILGLIGTPFQFILLLVIDRTGRKKASFSLLMASAVFGFGALAALLLVPDSQKTMRDTIINVCNLLAKGIESSAWSAVAVITGEIYPTVIRGLGNGAANTAARIGGILAPFALNFEDTPDIAFALMGSVLFVSACLVCLLEETVGKAMQDTSKSITASAEVPLKLHQEMTISAIVDENIKSTSHNQSPQTGHSNMGFNTRM